MLSDITVGLHIHWRRILDERMHRSDIIRGKWNTVVGCGEYIVEGIEGSLHTSNGRFVAIRSKIGWTMIRSGQVEWASQPILPMRLWYASFHLFSSGKLLSLDEWALEPIGTPEQYGVAVGVWLRSERKKLSTRLEAKPDWLRWTVTNKGVTHHKKWMPRIQLTISVKGTLHRLARRQQKRASTVGSSEKYTKLSTYSPRNRGHSNLLPEGSEGSWTKLE